MDTKDPIDESAKLVVDAYRFALNNNLDIANKEDVLKILQALDPEHATEEQANIFMQALVVFDKMTKAELSKRKESN